MNDKFTATTQSQFFNTKFPKDHIHIRSVIYKKNLVETKTEFPDIIRKNTPLLSTNAEGFPKDDKESNNFNPCFRVTLHKLGTSRKDQNALALTHTTLNSSKLLKTAKSTGFLSKKNLSRMMPTDFLSEELISFENIKNRIPFFVKFPDDEEERNEQHNAEYFTNKICNGKLTSLKDFYKRNYINQNIEIPDEQTIREQYRFKFPVNIGSLENENTYATHVLAIMNPNFKFIELNIESVISEISASKLEKEEIRKDMDNLLKDHQIEIESINKEFSNEFEKLEERIKEDFIINQNEYFKLQKDITLLKRDKLNLENQIDDLLEMISLLENQFYGLPMYEFKSNDPQLDIMTNNNLREEVQHTMTNRDIIH